MKASFEQFKEWLAEAEKAFPGDGKGLMGEVARLAYAAGADAELEACCEWLTEGPFGLSCTVNGLVDQLRAARRPKPPSLKQEAIKALRIMSDGVQTQQYDAIRAALESLPD
jgi:hypothetical protein